MEKDSKTAAEELFKEVNEATAELATQFGVPSLKSVAIDRGARLKIFPLGSKQEWFSDQTAGARLRLRIAVAIALLRVGRANGVSTHPGLLLIDSPKSEEMQSADAHKLFKELATVAAESDLQVVITTADFDLARAALPPRQHPAGRARRFPLVIPHLRSRRKGRLPCRNSPTG